MRAERHLEFEQRIDRSLAGTGTAEEEFSLQEHLEVCAECAKYLKVSQRAIAGLKGFSFEAGMGLNTRVVTAIRARAEQMEAQRASLRRRIRLNVFALALTLAGTVVDLRVGHWVAGFFDLPPIEVRQGLLALWILPSFALLLLFPLLPQLTAKGFRKGRTI
jgi:anti-sigma factor RsiW